jgi:hypothetical protein
MNLIGKTIKTHDNGYIGQVVEQELSPVGVKARQGQGIKPNELYVAYAVRLDGGKDDWSHVIARSDEDAFAKYVVA